MSILTNRWIQAVGAIAVLGICFFVYQTTSNDETTTEIQAEAAIEAANSQEGAVEVVNVTETEGTGGVDVEATTVDPVTTVGEEATEE